MFKNDINSVLLIDGYSTNGKILYATPNFPYIYRINGKEIINTSIEELLPNVVLPFHKDLMDNILKYSNVTTTFNNDFNIYLKGKNNALFYVSLYVKPVPNLSYGLIYFLFLSKIQEHEFTILLDKDFKIDGFTEMNLGNSFTLNNNANNNYNLTSQAYNHHIGKVIPEILLELCYKDNLFYVEKNDIDIKGNLYALNNLKDNELDKEINILLDIIKKKGFLDVNEYNEESKKALRHYHDLIDELTEKNNKSYSIFFKIETRKFLDDKYRYHRIYVINDNLYLVENTNFITNKNLNMYVTISEYCEEKKDENLMPKGTFNIDDEENDILIKKKSFKSLNTFYSKFLGTGTKETFNDNYKVIKLRIPTNLKIKKENNVDKKNGENKDNNIANNREDNETKYNKKENLENNEDDTEYILFGRLKLCVMNKDDSIQVTFMKISRIEANYMF